MRTIGSNEDYTTLLDAVVTEGASKPWKLAHAMLNHTWEIKIGDSSPTAIIVLLEGSLDGVNWYTMDTYNVVADTMRHVVNMAVRIIRANLTVISGGGSPVPNISVRYLPSVK